MLTGALRGVFEARARRALARHEEIEGCQREVLAWLLGRGARTEWGLTHGYADLRSYEDYREAVAVSPYDELRPLVMRMVGGERDILWPGRVRNFAQSSGTSDGRSKYIPITDESLRLNHYRGGSDAVAHYLSHRRDSRLFDGRAFILGGSFSTGLHPAPGVKVGDLSATLIDRINPLVNLVRIPSKRVALLEDWNVKLPALAHAAAHANITNISGVPSWFLTVLKEVRRLRGVSTIAEAWPRLEVFFHGGISMEPYREQYRELIGSDRMAYVETYNASEGFFAVQDCPEVRAMSLILDAGMFYEFDSGTEIVPAWEVEAGRVYSLLLSGCNGLWRYPIGDTVKIESTRPLRITIAGRTKHYINAFGEELMVYNADRALARACEIHGCSVANYTAAPQFIDSDRSNGRHQWLIEFDTAPRSVEAFADTLDECLRRENSDYDAKRTGDIFLTRLDVVTARRGQFDRWLATTGKLGGQRKIPRLSNTRTFLDAILNA